MASVSYSGVNDAGGVVEQLSFFVSYGGVAPLISVVVVPKGFVCVVPWDGLQYQY